MKAGAKPKHAFNSLKIGQKALLTGSAETYPHQFINQFNRSKEAKLKVIREGTKIYAKRISILIPLFLLVGCLHKSELKHETGYVIDKQYFPDTQQTVTGTGFSSKGSLVVTSHHIGSEEKYMVILKCEHGNVFSINNPRVFGNLNKSDTVTIDFFEMLNNDNEVKDFDFIDAYKQ